MFSIPFDGALQRAFDGIPGQTEFANSLRRVEPHLVPRELHAFERNVGLPASDVDGPKILEPRIRFCDPVRHFHLRRSDFSDACKSIEQLFQSKVAAAENVAFADSAL